jgi:hypothetical protein
MVTIAGGIPADVVDIFAEREEMAAGVGAAIVGGIVVVCRVPFMAFMPILPRLVDGL